MAKTWEQMTTEEKVEDLRIDMKRTMETVNLWIEQQKQFGAFHNELRKKVSEVSEAVRALAERSKEA